LYRYQEELLIDHDGHRILVVLSAPQIGKTVAVAAWLLSMSWYCPGSISWWAAPTYRQCQQGFRTMRGLASTAGVLNTRSVRESKSDMGFKLINGTEIQFVSWEKYENLSGPSVHFMVLDESHRLTRAAWNALEQRTSSTLGYMRLIGNSGDVDGEFKRQCDLAADPANTERAFCHWTWEDRFAALGGKESPAGRAYYDAMQEKRRNMPGAEFDSIYGAQWQRSGAQVFRCVDIQTFLAPRRGGVSGVEYIIAWDIADSGDYTAGVPMPVPRREDQVLTVTDIERFHRVGFRMIEDRIVVYGRLWGPPPYGVTTHYIEANNQGAVIAENLAAAGVPVDTWTTTNKWKHEATLEAAGHLEGDRVRLAECSPLQAELKSIRKRWTERGLPHYAAPEGYNDDCYIGYIAADWWARRATSRRLGWA
jgi:hypothetical protein